LRGINFIGNETDKYYLLYDEILLNAQDTARLFYFAKNAIG